MHEMPAIIAKTMETGKIAVILFLELQECIL